MTSTATDIRREQARDKATGQFGEQHHTLPAVALGEVNAAVLDEAWEERKDAARAVSDAHVAVIAANLPDSVRGVRYVIADGHARPMRLIPIAPGVTPEAGDFTDTHLGGLTALVQWKDEAVELNPTYEQDGREAWDWVPSQDAREMTPEQAAVELDEAMTRLRAADHQFNERARTYLQEKMPENVVRVEVAYGPLREDDGKIVNVPTIVGAYDEDDILITDIDADYMANVARANIDALFPYEENDADGRTYIITRGGPTTPCPTDKNATLDKDGFCSAHGWDCGDFTVA